jgi:hypothetical protein
MLPSLVNVSSYDDESLLSMSFLFQRSASSKKIMVWLQTNAIISSLLRSLRCCCSAQEDWLEKVCPVIQERIERYSHSEIRFNLMAVIGSRKAIYAQQIADLERRRAVMHASIGTAMDEDQPGQECESSVTVEHINDELER